MAFHPISITIPHVAYACLGGFVVIFGMFSLFLREKLYIGEACWAFLFGVIIGPYGANIFNPRGWGGGSEETINQITLEFTRVVLAIGVFAIGVELPKAYMARHWKSLFFLLVPVMAWGWFVSAGLIYALIPGLNFLSSLAVAACLTPTDPILAAAVVGGKYADKHVPAHIRHLLAAESGCNDGAAYPFLFIALYLTLDSSTGQAIEDWFLELWLYQVILGVVLGSVLGYAFRHLMKFCQRKDLIDRQSYVAQYVSLAFLTIGLTTIIGSDDLLAAFSCGTAFAWDGFFNRQTEESVFSSVIDLIFNVAAFVFVGAWMPFNDFQDATLTLSVWRLIVIAILVLLLRRLPIMVALYKFIPDVKTFREAIFSGHFGPIGIGAVFISTLAAQRLPVPSNPPANQTELLAATIQPIVSFMVLCSITIHGLSIPSFSLGRRVHSVSSRTWSRHAAPDWTTQARHIHRGDEIVINRDPDAAERGELTLTADEKAALESKRASMSTATVPREGEDAAEITDEGSSQTKTETERRDPEDTMREENPPDGSEVVSEWQEGPHRIVERRAGPGEEVEVEVIRNAFEPDQSPQRASFRASEEAVRHTIDGYIDRLRHAPHEINEEIGRVGERLKHNAQLFEAKTREALHEQNTTNDEEEEEWSSDRSDGEGQTEVSASDAHVMPDRKKRSKGPKQKNLSRPTHMGWGRRGRRRLSSSSNGTLSGHAQQFMQHSQPSSPPFQNSPGLHDEGHEVEDARGRTHQHLRENSDNSHRGFAINRRLDSIRAQDTLSRDVSPSRSVRFADEGTRSGSNTPRTLLSQGFDFTNVESPVGDDADSSRGRVTFDLSSKH